MEATYAELATEAIEANPDQPRRHFDAEALGELARSIADQGLLQPIVVRPMGDTHVIIAGERRWRASKLAGLPTISCRVLVGLDETEAFTLSVLENVARRDMQPLEEANAYAALRQAGKSVADIAAATGKSVRWVTMFLDLLELSADLQHLLDGGGIKTGLAWSASRLEPAAQQVLLRRHLAGEFASDADGQAYCTAVRDAEGQGSLFADPQTPAERESLLKRRAALATKLDRINVAGYVLGEIAEMDPADVAVLLRHHPGGVAGHREAVRDVAEQARKALAVLRKASAITDAHPVLSVPDGELAL